MPTIAIAGNQKEGFFLGLLSHFGQTSSPMPKQRQLELWGEEEEPERLRDLPTVADTKREIHRTTRTLLKSESVYASLKRVSLVYEGSLNGRPCLKSTQESKAFFARYWSDHPANDQEKFVVACLDT